METRYQVFVSSTYKDLREERQEVMQALLKMDCFPAGMELFPAADDDQWTLIKRVIDDCDYYIVILAGRYGSLGSDGKSFTQLEYEYAVSKGKPVIAFLYENPGKLPDDKKTEEDPKGKKKLDDFRRHLVEEKAVGYWTTPERLGSVVSSSLHKLIKEKPGTGWVKADSVASQEATQEILDLKRQVEKLQHELERVDVEATKKRKRLAQGKDKEATTDAATKAVTKPDAATEADGQDVHVALRPGFPYPHRRRSGKVFTAQGEWFTAAEWSAMPPADREAITADTQLVVRQGRRGEPSPIVTVTFIGSPMGREHSRAGMRFSVDGTTFTRAEWEALPAATRQAILADPTLTVAGYGPIIEEATTDAATEADGQDVWVGRRPGTRYPIRRRAGKAFTVEGTWFKRAEWEAMPDADRQAIESDTELIVRTGRQGEQWPIVTVTLSRDHPTPTHRRAGQVFSRGEEKLFTRDEWDALPDADRTAILADHTLTVFGNE